MIHKGQEVARIGSDGFHYDDVIMGAISSQITSLTIVYPTDYSGAYQSKNIKVPRHWPLCGEFTVNSPHKWPVTRKISPFDDVIMCVFGCRTNLVKWSALIITVIELLSGLWDMGRYAFVSIFRRVLNGIYPQNMLIFWIWNVTI